MYCIIEEASEAIIAYYNNFDDAVKDANSRKGKYLIIDDKDTILYDTQPGISYKI